MTKFFGHYDQEAQELFAEEIRLAMAMTLTTDVLEDNLAVSLAAALAAANKRALEAGVDALQSVITIAQSSLEGRPVWRINYGSKDYVGRRGGDLIVEVDSEDASIKRTIRGQ